MSGLLDNKVCIITGAGRGIGKAIALLFASEGASVIINELVEGSADEWVRVNQYKDQLDCRYFDITDETAVKAAVWLLNKNTDMLTCW